MTPASPAPSFCRPEEIPPRKLPLFYRFTVGLTAAVTLLLPCLYALVVLAIAWTPFIYFFHGDTVKGEFGWLTLILPGFIGGLLTSFFIKPFFVRKTAGAQLVALDPNRHRRLQALIGEICAKLGAPMPARIEVDCGVNASASLRRGLLSIGQDDYVLGLGLPLAAGLSTRQFAGVIAHELAHFRQRGGLSSRQVIATVDSWFARTVFQRDSLDRALERAMDRTHDARVIAILATCVGLVWFGRKILYGAMLASRAVSSLQSRQMEFDADYYEAAIIGSSAFGESMREIGRLHAASTTALTTLDTLWKSGRLAADFPALILQNRTSDHPSAVGVKTSWLDTHPSEAKRTARAEALQLPGVFCQEGMAADLFDDFAGLCQLATQQLYRVQMGLPFDESALVATSAIGRTTEEATVEEAAARRLFGTLFDFNRPLLWRRSDFAPAGAPATPAALQAAFAALRQRLIQAHPVASRAHDICTNIEKNRREKQVALSLLSARVTFRPAALGLTLLDSREAEAEYRKLTERLDTHLAQVRPFSDALHEWICLLGQAARSSVLAGRLSEEKIARIVTLTDGLADLAPWFQAFHDWNTMHAILHTLNSLRSEAEGLGPAFDAELQRRRLTAATLVERAPGLAGEVPFPFPANGQTGEKAAAVLTRILQETPEAARLGTLLHTTTQHHWRLLRELVALGEQAEQLDREAAKDGTTRPG